MVLNAIRWLWPPGAPTARQLPEAIFRAAMLGAVVALPLSFLFAPIASWRFFWIDPWAWFLKASAISVTFSLSFYLACGLPVSYVLRQRSATDSSFIVWTTAILGGASGTLTALLVFALMRRALSPELVRLAVADGILAALLSVMTSAWYRIKSETSLADMRAQTWALKAQINPHFYFNTLSTIASLIKSNPDAAERTIGLLADMSRYTFASIASGVVPLERELDFARAYLEIEQARFEDRLTWTLPAPQVVEGLAAPPMTVQPLVENAVRHGISKRIGGGSLSIDVYRSAGDFTLTLDNPTDGEVDLSTFFRHGHALWNVRERLRLTYGTRASIAATRPQPDSVRIRLRLPIQ